MSQSTQVGVRAIIKRENRIVFVEHREKNHGVFYLFPGGGIESGESIFEAAEREVAEETNLKVKAQKIMYVRETKYKDSTGIEFYVLCEWIGGELKLGHDPEENKQSNQVLVSAREISFNELNTVVWHPSELHNRIVDDFTNSVSIQYLGMSIVG